MRGLSKLVAATIVCLSPLIAPSSAEAELLTIYSISFQMQHDPHDGQADILGLHGAAVTLTIAIDDSWNPNLAFPPADFSEYWNSLHGVQLREARISGSGSVDGTHYFFGILGLLDTETDDTVALYDLGIAFTGGGGLNMGPMGVRLPGLASTLPTGQVKPFAFEETPFTLGSGRGLEASYPGIPFGADYDYVNIRGSAIQLGVPEPGTGLLCLLGFAGVGGYRKRFPRRLEE